MSDPRVTTQETCGECTAYHESNAPRKLGICKAVPPLAILVAMPVNPITQQPQPLVDGFWPPVARATGRCRDGFERRSADAVATIPEAEGSA